MNRSHFTIVLSALFLIACGGGGGGVGGNGSGMGASYPAIMVLDRSGSMASDDPNNNVLTAADTFATGLATSENMSVMAFPNEPSANPINALTLASANELELGRIAQTTDGGLMIADNVHQLTTDYRLWHAWWRFVGGARDLPHYPETKR